MEQVQYELEEELSDDQIGILVQRPAPVVRVQVTNTSGNPRGGAASPASETSRTSELAGAAGTPSVSNVNDCATDGMHPAVSSGEDVAGNRPTGGLARCLNQRDTVLSYRFRRRSPGAATVFREQRHDGQLQRVG